MIKHCNKIKFKLNNNGVTNGIYVYVKICHILNVISILVDMFDNFLTYWLSWECRSH